MSTNERQLKLPIYISGRRPGEGTLTYRRRIARLIPHKDDSPRVSPKITKDQALQSIRTGCYDQIVMAYHGFIAQEGELVTGKIGIHMDPSAVEYNEGGEALEEAYYSTYGKPMNRQDFLGEARKVLLCEEHRVGHRLAKIDDFLSWADRRTKEIRERDQIRPEASNS